MKPATIFLTVAVFSITFPGQGLSLSQKPWTLSPDGVVLPNHHHEQDVPIQTGPKIFYLCPDEKAIAPCECQHPSQITLTVICKGPLVTQEIINNTFNEIRAVNDLYPDTWLDMNTITVENTSLTHLDLSVFYRTSIIYFFDLRDNPFLTSVTSPSSADYERSIRVSYIWFQGSSLTEAGFGRALAFFEPRVCYGISFASNKFESSAPGQDLVWGLSNFTRIDSLTISNNNLTSIGGGQFKRFNKMEHFTFIGNSLVEFGDDAFLVEEPLPEMEDKYLLIWLDKNKMTDEGMNNERNGLFNITYRPLTLTFDGNSFETISAGQFEPLLRGNVNFHMTLEDNPIVCDERLRWLKEDQIYFEQHIYRAYCSNDPGETIFTSNLV